MANSSSGLKVYLGPSNTAADSASEYAALSYTALESIDNVSEFGDEASDVTFTSMSDGRVQHFPGARDAGTMTVTCAHEPAGTGQIAAVAAAKTKLTYAVKVEFADKLTVGGTNTIVYFHATLRSSKVNPGSASDILKRTFMFGIVDAPIEVAAT